MEFINSPWVFGSIASICVLLIIIVIKGSKFKITRDGATMSHTEKEETQPLIPEKYAKEIIYLVQKTADYHTKTFDLNNNLIKLQMRVYEELELSAISLLREAFLEIANKFNLERSVVRGELLTYTTTISYIFSKIKDIVRSSFINNHYHLMEDSEFDDYIINKKTTIVEIVSRELDLLWFSDNVERDSLRVIKEIRDREISELIAQLYRKSRRCSIENKEAIDLLTRDYNNYILRVTGVEITAC